MSIPDSACCRTTSATALLHDLFEVRRINGFAAVLREQDIDHVLRAGQAADVGGKNAVLAYFHFESVLLEAGWNRAVPLIDHNP